MPLADNLHGVREDKTKILPFGFEVVGQYVTGAIGTRVEVGRLAVMVPVFWDDDITDVSLWINAAGDSGEEHVADPEVIEGLLGVHGRIDHAHTAGKEQEVVAFEAHLLEDNAVDPPGGDTGSALGQDGFVGFDLRWVGGHHRDEGTRTSVTNCFQRGR